MLKLLNIFRCYICTYVLNVPYLSLHTYCRLLTLLTSGYSIQCGILALSCTLHDELPTRELHDILLTVLPHEIYDRCMPVITAATAVAVALRPCYMNFPSVVTCQMLLQACCRCCCVYVTHYNRNVYYHRLFKVIPQIIIWDIILAYVQTIDSRESYYIIYICPNSAKFNISTILSDIMHFHCFHHCFHDWPMPPALSHLPCAS